MFKHRLTVFTSILIFMSALSSCSVNGDDSSGSYEEIGVFFGHGIRIHWR